MQTFLPDQNFYNCAQILDQKRLGKQRVEVKQILIALEPNSTSRWRSHPAVQMWKGYEWQLFVYGLAICSVWKSEGFKDTVEDWLFRQAEEQDYPTKVGTPPWLTEEFCSRHRAALLFKNFEYYSQFGWTEEPKIDYIWPTKGQQ